MLEVKQYASFLYSFFKKYKKNIIIVVCSVMVVVVCMTTWNQFQMHHITSDIKEIMKKKDIKEGLFYLKSNKVYYLKNDERTLVGTTHFIGWVNGYVHSTGKKEMVEIWNYGILNYKQYQEKKLSYTLFMNLKKKTYEAVEAEQVFIVPMTGTYKIELWGASGGTSPAYLDTSEKHGKGAYTSGTIRLRKGTKLYLHVGSKGENGKIIEDYRRFTAFGYPAKGGKGGYNGGGDGMDDAEMSGAGGGGGATDIRLVSGNWDDFDSLKSRIMVAGAGGGMSRLYDYTGSYYAGTGESGSGGALKGKDGRVDIPEIVPYGTGSTQTDGYSFGIGGNGEWCITTLNGLGGGAGGYMGSYPGGCNPVDWYPPNGAGGASSYVSGCKGCKAIKEESTKKKLIFEKDGIHYSGFKFKQIQMIDGDHKMPGKNGKTTKGNEGNGYARIERVGF